MKPTTKEVAVTSKKSETSSLPNPTSMTQAEPVILELAKELLRRSARDWDVDCVLEYQEHALVHSPTIATELISVTAENDENCRLLGISGSKELALLTAIDNLKLGLTKVEAERDALREAMEGRIAIIKDANYSNYRTIPCAGCNKKVHEVKAMVALIGNRVICDECSYLCVQIIEEDAALKQPAGQQGTDDYST
jgi:hypothetical protein